MFLLSIVFFYTLLVLRDCAPKLHQNFSNLVNLNDQKIQNEKIRKHWADILWKQYDKWKYHREVE